MELDFGNMSEREILVAIAMRQAEQQTTLARLAKDLSEQGKWINAMKGGLVLSAVVIVPLLIDFLRRIYP